MGWISRALRRVLAGSAVVAMAGAAAPAQAALVAYYTFDETSGTTAAASVGGIDGTLSGTGVAFAPGAGVQGGAVSFSGSGGAVSMGDNFGFAGSSFSIQAWVRTTVPGFPVAKHAGGNASGYFMMIGDAGDGCGGASGQVNFYLAYPCSGNSAQTVNDDEWHQIVATYDAGSTVVSVFVDGLLATSSPGGNQALATPPGTEFLVGAVFVNGSPFPAFGGLVDELRIYDTALTAEEVSLLYTSTLQSVPEPVSMTLFGTGVLGLAALRRRAAARG